jgi:transposase
MINDYAKDHVEIQLLQTIPGFGPIVSSNFYSMIGDGKAFSNGRGVSASLGIVPRQHSSGGKNTLLGISKRGDKYLRSLMIHGARAVVRVAHTKDDALSRWVTRLIERRGKNKAIVALANKLARIGWAVITSGKPYEVNYHAV